MKTRYILTTLLLALSLHIMALTPRTWQHIDAAFTQTRHSALLASDQVMTGRFSYDAPDQVNWRYDDGYVAQLPPQMLQFISRSVGGEYLEDNAEFQVVIEGNTAILTPKRRQLKQLFREIRIVFDPATTLAREVILTETSDDVTTIRFSQMHSR